MRTMTQLEHECRQLPPTQAEELLAIIATRGEEMQISWWRLFCRERLGLRSLSRCWKMRPATRETRSSRMKAS